MKAQDITRGKMGYKSPFQPYLAYWGLAWNIVFILITGLPVFFHFTASGFLTAYINIPLFLSVYFAYKIVRKTKFRSPRDMDFATVSMYIRWK